MMTSKSNESDPTEEQRRNPRFGYVADTERRIRRACIFPQRDKRIGSRATLSFLILKDGRCSNLVVESSEGSEEFVENCKIAVTHGAPFRPINYWKDPLAVECDFNDTDVKLKVLEHNTEVEGPDIADFLRRKN